MTFNRLLRSDWLAFAAALALLLVMAMDWYSTTTGEEARRIERTVEPEGALGGEIERRVGEDARFAAEAAEKNAWQADGAIDRVILIALLLTAALAITAAFARAGGRRGSPPFTPSGLAGAAASVTGMLVVYRIIQEPGLDARTTIESGAPIALIALGVLALASVVALRAEESGAAWKPLEREAAEREQAKREAEPKEAT